MKKINPKKLILLNLPYVLIGAFATNFGEAFRIAEGANLSEKLQSVVLGGGFAAAFSNPMPSLHPVDLLIGVACGGALRLAVYMKGKNAKNTGMEKNMDLPDGEIMRILNLLLTRSLPIM